MLKLIITWCSSLSLCVDFSEFHSNPCVLIGKAIRKFIFQVLPPTPGSIPLAKVLMTSTLFSNALMHPLFLLLIHWCLVVLWCLSYRPIWPVFDILSWDNLWFPWDIFSKIDVLWRDFPLPVPYTFWKTIYANSMQTMHFGVFVLLGRPHTASWYSTCRLNLIILVFIKVEL